MYYINTSHSLCTWGPSARLSSQKKFWWFIKKKTRGRMFMNLVFVNDQATLVFCVLCTLTILWKILARVHLYFTPICMVNKPANQSTVYHLQFPFPTVSM